MSERAKGAWGDVVIASLSGTALLIVLFLLVVASSVTMTARPAFEKTFEEFGAELPPLTNAVLAVPGWLCLGAFAGLATVLVVKEVALRRVAILNLCLNVSVGWVLIIAGLLVYYVALGMPMLSLFQALKG